MHIVILGGVGFIGTNLALAALARGHTVTAFDNLSRTGVTENLAVLLGKKGCTFLHGDVRNIEDFDRLPKKADCLVNLAANPAIPVSILKPRYDFFCNIVGHLNVLDYAKNHGNIPVILASSNKVYTDKINTLPIRETKMRYVFREKKYQKGFDENIDVSGHEGFTNSPYGAGKLAAEKYSREYWKHYGVPIVINRMSCIYGLFQKGVADQGWVDHFLRTKKFGGKLIIYGTGKQVRDALFASDLTDLYLWQIEHIGKVNGKTFNVGGGTKKGFTTSVLELIALIDTHFPGNKLSYRFAPWRGSDQRIYESNIFHVSHVTHWKPTTSLLAGLTKMWHAYG